MRKKGRSNIYRITGKICFGLAIVGFITAGCKKKEVAPPPAVQVQPLPKREVLANSSASKQATAQPKGSVAPAVAAPAIHSKPSPAKVATPIATTAAVPKPAVPSPSNGTAPLPATGKSPVQKRMSSPRLSPAPMAISLDFTNRRDPFKPYAQVIQSQQAIDKAGRSRKDALPIQKFDTEKFRVSGIITGVRENSALVIDPSGKGYVVRAGMQLGNNDGRIKRITDSTLEVEENFIDDFGKVKKRLVKLMLIRKK